MKKTLLIIGIVVLLAVIGAVGFGWYTYENTGMDSVPIPELTAFGGAPVLTEWHWSTPVLGGILHKQFTSPIYDISLEQLTFGPFETVPREMALPEGFAVSIRLDKDGETLHNGPAEGWDWALVEAPGEYKTVFGCEKGQGDETGAGAFYFTCYFTVEPPPPPPEEEGFTMPDEPEFVAGATTLQQGDIFSMQVKWLPEGEAPTATTELGLAVFTPGEHGCWYAAVPIGNSRAPGEYPVQVQAGQHSWDATVTVETFPFDEQNLIIDTSDPVISEANSPEAYAEYRAKIPPLFGTFDDVRYWEGKFIQPAQGWISTNFGEIRYTNGDYSNPRSHNGMDIAAGEGSEVLVPNHGRVVLAEYLLNTGWTVVIEHGGGLKSYYFHMLEIYVEPEQMVQQGELMGLVGTTGYSTGPHLHFEMRIGEWPVSPQMLFEDTAGLYSAGALPEEEEAAA